jgi:hypothetical protein
VLDLSWALGGGVISFLAAHVDAPKLAVLPCDVPVCIHAGGVQFQGWARDPSGIYQGSLDVTVEGRSARVPIQLKVLNFTLPSSTSLKSSFGLSLDTQCTALELPDCSDSSQPAYAKQLFVRAALDNRVSIAYAHASPISTPRA